MNGQIFKMNEKKLLNNFYAGPSMLPHQVLEEASEAIRRRDDLLSIIEISHRSKRFDDVVDELYQLTRELLQLSDKQKICFLQGGARQQFYQIPFNFSEMFKTNYYVDTGTWTNQAIKEGKFFGPTEIIASSKDQGYKHIPKINPKQEKGNFVYTCTNNTVYGTQFFETPETTAPLIADMSSDLFGIERDFTKYDLFYSATQKNAGTAGACLVVINEELFSKDEGSLPTMLDYRTHIKKKSLYNTPPVFAFVMSLLVFRWIKEKGGIAYFDKKNREKANLIYTELERNSLFEVYADKEHRSIMNAVFTGINQEVEDRFLPYAEENDIIGIKGHRIIGGFRASMYNALTLDNVKALVECMQEFERTEY